MEKVIVGMSGGVDSSVTAALLVKKGYEVIGVTVVMRDGAEEDIRDAKAVCNALGIEHHVIDMRDVFRRDVIDYFVTEYCNICTPNPCNMCNRYAKWRGLTEEADRQNAEYVATGHYARIEKKTNGRYTLRNSETAEKDQTYALCFLTQEQLSRTLMPLGDYTKEQVRKLAEEYQLPVAHKKDSQDICFVENGNYVSFIDKYMSESANEILKEDIGTKYHEATKPGNFVDFEGNVLGKHKGMLNYTYGQRRGLGVSAKTRLCVVDMKPETGNILLGQDEDAFSGELVCSNLNLMSIDRLTEPIRAWVKIRYAHKGEMAVIYPISENAAGVVFDNPVRAVTPGQPVVFYDGDTVLGAGIIQKNHAKEIRDGNFS